MSQVEKCSVKFKIDDLKMLQWKGGIRRKVKQNADSIASRQKKFFQHQSDAKHGVSHRENHDRGTSDNVSSLDLQNFIALLKNENSARPQIEPKNRLDIRDSTFIEHQETSDHGGKSNIDNLGKSAERKKKDEKKIQVKNQDTSETERKSDEGTEIFIVVEPTERYQTTDANSTEITLQKHEGKQKISKKQGGGDFKKPRNAKLSILDCIEEKEMKVNHGGFERYASLAGDGTGLLDGGSPNGFVTTTDMDKTPEKIYGQVMSSSSKSKLYFRNPYKRIARNLDNDVIHAVVTPGSSHFSKKGLKNIFDVLDEPEEVLGRDTFKEAMLILDDAPLGDGCASQMTNDSEKVLKLQSNATSCQSATQSQRKTPQKCNVIQECQNNLEADGLKLVVEDCSKAVKGGNNSTKVQEESVAYCQMLESYVIELQTIIKAVKDKE